MRNVQIHSSSSSAAAAAAADSEAAAQQDVAVVGHATSTNSSRSRHAKRKLTSNSTAFLASHPQYLTHHFVKRKHPQLPKSLYEPPPRPAQNAASEQHEAWAAYIVAKVAAHKVLLRDCPQLPFGAAACLQMQ
jgi:hypothetical protein